MKICITAQGDNLDSKVESRFGRSPYFIIYDTDAANFEAIKNPNIDASSGVGIKSGQMVADKKVSVVLTGKVGPKASDALKAAGIKIIDSASGTVKEVLDKYQASGFKTNKKLANKPQFAGVSQGQDVQTDNWFSRCLRGWFGFGSGRGGRGRQGGGFGQGMGQGRSMGRGQGGGKRGFNGPGGCCVCPKCGEKIEHVQGVPCRSNTCGKCGTIMVRE